jgi:dTDP-4-dehydrorhamnose reductase
MEGHVNEPLRIVLFGISGQLGSRLMTTLADAGYEVTGLDRRTLDFTTATAKEIAVKLRAVEPHLVINAAAYTAVDAAENEVALAQRINAEIPEIIAQTCAEQSVPMIHFSTDYVFDGARGAPYAEDATPHPLNAYAHSKLGGEQAVRQHGGYVFRLQWVYAGTGKNFFCTMKKLLSERDEVRVVADQLGAPSHALHVAQAITQAAPNIISGEIPAGIYHLTSQGHTSWHGFACAIAQALNSRACVVPIVTTEYPTPAIRPKDTRLDCSALASFGIRMPHWRDGISLAVKESE